MITIKFPSFEKAISKNLKELDDDDPRRGIIVLNNNAIVINEDFCFVINLYDYFTIECGIESEDEIDNLKKILFYMNGKIFNSEFWKELTKGSNMRITNGLLYIENPKYAKDLHYTHADLNVLEPLEELIGAAEMKENLISAIGLPFNALKTIYDCLASDFKTDIIIFEFNAQDQPVKFTFRKRKHFFGYILPHYNSVQEGFRFESLKSFTEDEDIKDLVKELQSQVPLPPPEIPKEDFRNEELDPNQLKIDGYK